MSHADRAAAPGGGRDRRHLPGALAGWRSVGLGLLAASYPLIVVAIGSAQLSDVDLLAASESIFSVLFVPVILLMVSLVLGVGLFRARWRTTPSSIP